MYLFFYGKKEEMERLKIKKGLGAAKSGAAPYRKLVLYCEPFLFRQLVVACRKRHRLRGFYPSGGPNFMDSVLVSIQGWLLDHWYYQNQGDDLQLVLLTHDKLLWYVEPIITSPIRLLKSNRQAKDNELSSTCLSDNLFNLSMFLKIRRFCHKKGFSFEAKNIQIQYIQRSNVCLYKKRNGEVESKRMLVGRRELRAALPLSLGDPR